jgi:hypothetical protein
MSETSATSTSTVDELRRAIARIEECYEYFLAYAAQGYDGRGRSEEGGRLRDFLAGAAAAMRKLDPLLQRLLAEEWWADTEGGEEQREALRAFHTVVARDAEDALAALRLVEAQEVVSSQLVDNLNASIHLRALLTDLFLVDEVLAQ